MCRLKTSYDLLRGFGHVTSRVAHVNHVSVRSKLNNLSHELQLQIDI